jgi:hypothetical protein
LEQNNYRLKHAPRLTMSAIVVHAARSAGTNVSTILRLLVPLLSQGGSSTKDFLAVVSRDAERASTPKPRSCCLIQQSSRGVLRCPHTSTHACAAVLGRHIPFSRTSAQHQALTPAGMLALPLPNNDEVQPVPTKRGPQHLF